MVAGEAVGAGVGDPLKTKLGELAMIRKIQLIIAAFAVGAIGCSHTFTPRETAVSKEQSPMAKSQQETYGSPEAAVDALAQAVATRDRDELRQMFGPRVAELRCGDPAQDERDFQRMAAALQRGYRLEDVAGGGKRILIGPDAWEFPVPLVMEGKQWKFDTAEGIEEVIDRRVGRNELDAIATCGYYVAAQELYFQLDPDKDSVHCYAQRVPSTPGKRDGLYWDAKDDQPQSPLGPLVERAVERGELKQPVQGQRQPYRGYFYKVLERQGPAAPGGEMNYVDADGRMTGGFGLLAWPAEYGRSGVMSFMVAKDGMVYQADLGQNTPQAAAAIDAFNPDAKWSRAEEPTTAPAVAK